jgi:hypothetical protein
MVGVVLAAGATITTGLLYWTSRDDVVPLVCLMQEDGSCKDLGFDVSPFIGITCIVWAAAAALWLMARRR